MTEDGFVATIEKTISNYEEATSLAELKLKLLDEDPNRAYHDGKVSWSYWKDSDGKERSEGRASVESARRYINTDIEIFMRRKNWAERIRSLATDDGSAYPNGLKRILHLIRARAELAYELLTYDVIKENEWSLMHRNSMVIGVGKYQEEVPAYTALELVG
jgi:hypothetical protein